MTSPLNRPASWSAMRSRSCSSILDDVLEADVVADMGTFLSKLGLCRHGVLGARGALGEPAHRVEGGRHGLEVVAGHGVGVGLLLGGARFDAVDDQGKAEAELKVIRVAL